MNETIDQFLDRLATSASCVCGGERMRGASDKELQAWAFGIEDVRANVERLIAEWRTGEASGG
jgi:hypothetical protein